MISHEVIRAALSARVDGEPGGLDDSIVDAHVAECAECNAYYQRLLSLSQNLDFAEIDGGMAPPEDLSKVILEGVEGTWRTLSQRRFVGLAIGRAAVIIMAVVWVVWAVRGLVTPEPDPAMAAVRLGVASALLYAAYQPAQIPGIALVVGTMFTFTLGFVVRDAVLQTGGGLGVNILVLVPTLVALLATLAIDRGPRLNRAWRLLNSDPA